MHFRLDRFVTPADAAVRPLLGVLLLVVLPVGLWAAVLPGSFYARFPGLGHAWVSGDGPFNEHALRDVGTLYLALAIVLGYALMRPTRELVRAAALATLVSSVLHLAYHAVHLEALPSTTDAVLQTLALAVPVVVALMLLRVQVRSSKHQQDQRMPEPKVAARAPSSQRGLSIGSVGARFSRRRATPPRSRPEDSAGCSCCPTEAPSCPTYLSDGTRTVAQFARLVGHDVGPIDPSLVAEFGCVDLS